MSEKHAYLRPRDAATLIILREEREVLLGMRSSHHVFMPQRYVFPGGRVDAGDARVPSPITLRPQVEDKLARSVSPARARALAMAAVRETFEETGLILGQPSSDNIQTRSESWAPFYNTGFVPDLARLDYFARAITPPNRVRRFDARFFTVDSKYLHGELRGNGELEDLRWVNLDEVRQYPLASITELVLELLRQKLCGEDPKDEATPLFRALRGKELMEY